MAVDKGGVATERKPSFEVLKIETSCALRQKRKGLN